MVKNKNNVDAIAYTDDSFQDAPPSRREPTFDTWEEEENSFDIRAIISVLIRRFSLIASIVILVVSLAAIYAFTTTPQYTATVEILLDPRKKNLVEVESVLSGLPSDTNAVNTEVEILKSPALALRVIDDLDLVNEPAFQNDSNASILASARQALMELLPSRKQEEVTQDTLEVDDPRRALLEAVQSNMKVRRVGLTYVVEIQYTSTDKKLAKRIADSYADQYIDLNIQTALDANLRANEWLAGQLTGLRAKVREAEQEAASYRAEKGLANARGTTLNEQRLAEINAQLIEARADLAGNRARLRRIRTLLNSGGDAASAAEVVQSPTIAGLRAQQAEIIRRRAELSSRYGRKHPEIQKVESELNDLEAQIRAEVGRIVSSLENEVSISAERVTSLERSLESLETASSEDDQDFVELRQLEREAEAARVQYEAFLARYNQTAEASQFEEATARVIAYAEIPAVPSAPQKTRILLQAFILAGALGGCIAYLIEMLDNGLRTNSEVERATNYPVLASVPLVKNQDRKVRRGLLKMETLDMQHLMLEKPLSVFSESWRNLANAVTLYDIDKPPKAILVTSALPSEGKTTASLCYAQEIARSGKKVVIVDCDLRRGSLTETLNSTTRYKELMNFKTDGAALGLVEYLSGECSLEDVLIHDPETDLFCLPLAGHATNPSRILMSQSFEKLLTELSNRFDVVIIDSAPILPVADTRMLASKVDVVVFALRWEETPKQAAQGALKELELAKANIAGILFTQVDLDKQRRYGYSDGNYYYGKYGKEYS